MLMMHDAGLRASVRDLMRKRRFPMCAAFAY
jgi:hypothetical protein